MNDYLTMAASAGIDIPSQTKALMNRINRWDAIYRGSPWWRKTKKSGLYPNGMRNVALLNAAKLLCEELSAAAFTEQPTVSVSDEAYSYVTGKFLSRTSLLDRLERFLPSICALGGGAVRLYVEDGTVSADMVPADRFFATGWRGDTVTEGVFVSTRRCGSSCVTLFERHGFDKEGNVAIENSCVKSANGHSAWVKCGVKEYGNIPERIVFEGVREPMFVYIPSPAANNLFEDIPLGVSVFSSCTDTLRALDIAFDSFSREFVLGAKRIIVPSSAIRTVADMETGRMKRYFDANDEVFVALKCDDSENLKVIDNTVELRVEEHISAIKALLALACVQVGLSANSFDFDGGSLVRTATEVISDDSKAYRRSRGMQNILSAAVEKLVRGAVSAECCLNEEVLSPFDVNVRFRDNIIVDDSSRIADITALVSAGLLSKERAVMELYNLSSAEAAEELKRIGGEQDV